MSLLLAVALAQATGSITFHVDNVRNARGKVLVAVCPQAKFLKEDCPYNAEAPARPEAQDSGDGETILVIDDEPTVRMLVIEVLQENGYRVLEATDGPAGLKILQSAARIDLLITDVGLPGGLNGRQVADAARLVRRGLKVLFITGYADSAALGAASLEPGMEVITKPFVMATLGTKVRDLLERRGL